ncbi:hypothetical protein C1H46_035425 [Malus baccata]|uniref:Uncharacterized protein n=1 Tax=Malus baccata TaxID=106549 RepID=A0A540KY59_MALBA|nr:hypothetical protein C1H46_035425 [Malus baccata]
MVENRRTWGTHYEVEFGWSSTCSFSWFWQLLPLVEGNNIGEGHGKQHGRRAEGTWRDQSTAGKKEKNNTTDEKKGRGQRGKEAENNTAERKDRNTRQREEMKEKLQRWTELQRAT